MLSSNSIMCIFPVVAQTENPHFKAELQLSSITQVKFGLFRALVLSLWKSTITGDANQWNN